jgi:hypothetical protein
MSNETVSYLNEMSCVRASSEITSFAVSQSKNKGTEADECPEIISEFYYIPSSLSAFI